ncbi:MAG: tetratricopeptide repeat protein [Croceivirga sp.]|mgnify:FL=1
MKVLFWFLFLFFSSTAILGQDSIQVQNLLDEAYGYENSDPEKALDIYKKSYELSLEIEYYLGAFKSLNYSGIVYSNLIAHDSALYYYNESLKYVELANYPKGKATTLINAGNVYNYIGDYDKVVENYLEAIQIAEKLHDSTYVAITYQNLASVYLSLEKNDRAKDCFYKALQFVPKDDLQSLGILYGDLGLSEIKTGSLSKALTYFTKADSLSKLTDSKTLNFYVKRNFGEYHILKESYDKAIIYLEQSLAINSELNNGYFKADNLIKLGEAYYGLVNYDKTNTYLKQALEIGRKNHLKEIQERTYYFLAKIAYEQSLYQEAYDYLNLQKIFQDSVLNETYLDQINFYEKRFETKQKEAEIREQKLQLEKQENTILKKENEKTLAFAIGGFLVVALISLGLLFKQRQRAKVNEILALETKQEVVKLEALIDGEENERNRLAQDLHDGINGDLAVIKYKISSIGQQDLSPKEKEDYGEALNMLDNAVEQVRRISHNLAPPSLYRFDLTEAIEQFCLKQNTLQKVKISFQHFGNRVNLKKENETAIYRIVQELINNIFKHAEASEAMVQINNHGDTLTLTVEDDGKGFDIADSANGIGLQNIQSRADFLKAELDIDSNDQGTTFQIAIDLNKINET